MLGNPGKMKNLNTTRNDRSRRDSLSRERYDRKKVSNADERKEGRKVSRSSSFHLGLNHSITAMRIEHGAPMDDDDDETMREERKK